MSDCGVCLYAGESDGNGEFFNRKDVKARKTHVCHECGLVIQVGQKYEYAAWKYDGEFGDAKTCLICAEIGDAFYCDGRPYGMGDLWNQMREVMGELNSSCFDRLTTPAAKAELQRRWTKWKGLSA